MSDETSSDPDYENPLYDIQGIIKQIVKSSRKKPEINCQLTLQQVKYVVERAKDLISGEKTLLRVKGDVNIVGDVHGQFPDLLRIFNSLGHPPSSRYLFLGDYVDRGPNSLESILLLLAYKIAYPKHVHLLRGNHESAAINRIYGFYDECKRRYTIGIWRLFVELFDHLPLAAVVGEKIFCVHGGIGPSLRDMNIIADIERPLMVHESGLVTDLLWADPEPSVDWEPNERGVSFMFGETPLEAFLEANDLDLVCRAHQVVEDGYEFFDNRKLITIFSAPNYCGEFDNDAAVLKVDSTLRCSLFILKPL